MRCLSRILFASKTSFYVHVSVSFLFNCVFIVQVGTRYMHFLWVSRLASLMCWVGFEGGNKSATGAIVVPGNRSDVCIRLSDRADGGIARASRLLLLTCG